MGKFLSLIIASYFLTAANASAIDTVCHRDCVLQISGKLWDSTRSKYENARALLIAKGYALTQHQSDIAIRQIGREEFQLQSFGFPCMDQSSDSSDNEAMVVQWEGQLQGAPICIKSACGRTSFLNSKQSQMQGLSSPCLQPTQCDKQAPISQKQQF